MGLKVFPAPWSPAARDKFEHGVDSLWGLADSEAQRRLANEIIRYARGEVSGRSFLIAGHRGAGKTTAVLAAMQHVYNGFLDPKTEENRRPVLVRLHGPSLLIDLETATQAATMAPDPKREAPGASGEGAESAGHSADPATPGAETKSNDESESGRSKSDAKSGDDSPSKGASKSGDSKSGDSKSGDSKSGDTSKPDDGQKPAARLAWPELGLEFSERFLREMAAGIFPALIDEVRRRMTELAANQPELVAYTCDELGQGMPVGELRETFRRMGLLEAGLIGCSSPYEELVALNAAAEAYLVVTGKLDTESTLDAKAAKQASYQTAVDLTGDKIVKSVTPLAAAAAAALGISLGSPAAAIAVCAGIALSALAYTSSTSRSRSRAEARTRSFKRDNTHDSLVRRVPLLIEQLRRVGFPPVFVPDEVDKLPDDVASGLLEWLLRNLKSYVTERTFICFVVERKYYETVSKQQAGASADGNRYPPSYTYYSDYAYVVQTAPSLHRYLRAVLDEDAAPGAGALDADVVAHKLKQRQTAVLRHGLLNRARMHSYDLRRQLEQAVNRGDLRRIEDGAGLPVAWVYRALLQLAIEWVMSEALLRMGATDDPYAAQLQLDCLYQVSDAWEAGAPLPTDAPHNGRKDALGAAREHLLEYLRQPRTLLDHVREELDLERLDTFFRGEQEGNARDLDNVESELKKRESLVPMASDRARIRGYFARRKYLVLLEATADGVRPMLDVTSEWLVSPFGYSAGLVTLDPEVEDRVRALGALRAICRDEVKIDDGDFRTLWNVNSAISMEQLEIALTRRDRHPDDPEALETINRYAPVIPTASELVKVLTVGVAVLRAIRPVELAEAVRLLRTAIRGSTVHDRMMSAAVLVHSLAEEYEIDLPGDTREFLEAAGTGDLRKWMPRAGALPAPRADADTMRTRWHESMAQRLLASMPGATAPGPRLGEAEARRLDIVALLNEWCPVVLGGVWPKWERPEDWTIVVHSELLAEQPARAPGWLRAYAARRLGLSQAMQGALAPSGDTTTPSIARVLEWERAELQRMLAREAERKESGERGPPRVFVVNAGPVASKWLPPAQGFRVLGLRADATAPDFGAQFAQTSDLVISETVVDAPRELGTTRFFAIESTSPVSRPWRRLPASDTVVVLAPDSLEAAVETFLKAVEPED